MNFDSSQVGVPYVRAHFIEIHYPDGGLKPWASIHQSLAVKLADDTVRTLDPKLATIIQQFDLTDQSPIPLVDPTSGAALGPTVTLQQVMLSILAVVRKLQVGAFVNEPAIPNTPQPPQE